MRIGLVFNCHHQFLVKAKCRIDNHIERTLLTIIVNPKLHPGAVVTTDRPPAPVLYPNEITLNPCFELLIVRCCHRCRYAASRCTAKWCVGIVDLVDEMIAAFAERPRRIVSHSTCVTISNSTFVW